SSRLSLPGCACARSPLRLDQVAGGFSAWGDCNVGEAECLAESRWASKDRAGQGSPSSHGWIEAASDIFSGNVSLVTLPSSKGVLIFYTRRIICPVHGRGRKECPCMRELSSGPSGRRGSPR